MENSLTLDSSKPYAPVPSKNSSLQPNSSNSMRRFNRPCALLLLLLASCGGGDFSANATMQAGHDALVAKDYGTALEHFESALARIEPDHELYLDVKLSQLNALAHVDAERTKLVLLAVPRDVGLRANDFRSIVNELGEGAEESASRDESEVAAATMLTAVAILTEGKTVFPEYEGWDRLIAKSGQRAENLGADKALDLLRGLGYAGEDEPQPQR